MAYKKTLTKNKVQKKRRQIGLSSKADSVVSRADLIDVEFYEIEPAEVVDVILNDSHPNFNSWDDIGKAKVRLLYSSNPKDETKLTWAKPLGGNIVSYPLLHEIVRVAFYVGKDVTTEDELTPTIPTMAYYFDIINTTNNVTNNATYYVSNYNNEETDDSLGNSFVPNYKIGKLEQKEGDIVLQGRSGNSIRFGSIDGGGAEPILILRNGQNPEIDASDGSLVLEDVDNDLSIMIFDSNNFITEITLPTEATDSIGEKVDIDGNKIILNSDRMLIGSKIGDINILANRHIHLGANKIFGVDSDKIVFDTNEFNVVSGNIKFGEGSFEPLVLGDKLVSILEELIDAMMQETHPTGTGPSGPPINSSKYGAIKAKLSKIKSKVSSTE